MWREKKRKKRRGMVVVEVRVIDVKRRGKVNVRNSIEEAFKFH